ncbi:BLUF domain-containing protein [Hymenobacter sp.]|uniref:BLUF domain-containing protein n=1 Tax=Hymenobacter sp. TaxID=1898978 RepID=UPI00286A1DB1|nr:BLUF domain-containing protein [Hymenobacter sp.]
MGLYHLIYQSQSLVPFSRPELLALLRQCWTYNRLHHVTGVLLYTPDGRFLQVLEGEESVVTHLYYDRIVADPRHHQGEVLGEGPCQQRSFARWTMGFRTAQAHDLRELLADRPSTRPELLEMLLEFAAPGQRKDYL